MNNAKQLEYLRQQTKSYKSLIEDLKSRSSQEYDIRDFGYIVAAGSKLCEGLLGYLVQMQGYRVDYNRGMVLLESGTYQKHGFRDGAVKLFDFCISEKSILPEECRSFIDLIKQYRNKAMYAENELTYNLVIAFSRAMEGFIFWFEYQTDGIAQLSCIIGMTGVAIPAVLAGSMAVAGTATVGALAASTAAAGVATVGALAGAAVAGPLGMLALAVGKVGQSLINVLDSDDYTPEPVKQEHSKKQERRIDKNILEKRETDSYITKNEEKTTLHHAETNTSFAKSVNKNNINENDTKKANVMEAKENITVTETLKPAVDIEALMRIVKEQTELIKSLMQSSQRIEDKVNNIEQMIKKLSGEINAYQKLTERQLLRAESEDEAERLISSYTEECANCIVSNTIDTCNQDDNKVLKEEQEKLIKLIGPSGWDKLDETSQRFLVSARVLFRQFQKLQDIIDYSGVCVLVTKALEVEMDKRFYKNFLSFLNEKYKEDYTKYHTALLYKNKTILKPLKPQSFTMGNIAFVLCFIENRNDSDLQKENNRIQLLDYAKSKLLSKYSEEEIKELLREYAKAIEKIRKNFRNPSAHTNEIKRMDAENCLNLVLDVQKLLKRMLDSFDF